MHASASRPSRQGSKNLLKLEDAVHYSTALLTVKQQLGKVVGNQVVLATELCSYLPLGLVDPNPTFTGKNKRKLSSKQILLSVNKRPLQKIENLMPGALLFLILPWGDMWE